MYNLLPIPFRICLQGYTKNANIFVSMAEISALAFQVVLWKCLISLTLKKYFVMRDN